MCIGVRVPVLLYNYFDSVELVHVRLKLLCETKVSVVANDAFMPRRHLITTLTSSSLFMFGIVLASMALRSLNHNLDFVELVHVRHSSCKHGSAFT